MYVYVIVCSVNNKVYVGSTVYINARRNTHFSKLHCNTHPNQHLQSAYNAYGKDCFLFEILETCLNKADMLEREQYWLDKLQANNTEFGFNLRKEVNSNLGCKLSEETRAKMRKRSIVHLKGNTFTKGRKWTEESRRKLSLAKTGKIHTDETKEKIRRIRTGTKTPEIVKERMRVAQKLRWQKYRENRS